MRLILIFAFLLSPPARALNLFSMNVYMLPKPIKWSLQDRRTEVLGEQFKDSGYDVILFQEAFMKSFREHMIETLKFEYPYAYYLDRNDPYFFLMGSGVFILSRHPMKILDQVYFTDCAGFDCFASKGSVLAEVTLPTGERFQLASTHLEAGDEEAAIRVTQLAQIKAMLKKHETPGVTQFLIGDLNMDEPRPEYAEGLKVLRMKNAPLLGEVRSTNARVNDCYSTPEKKKWIDHALVDANAKFSEFDIRVKDLSFQLDGKTCPSSDHHGMEIRYVN